MVVISELEFLTGNTNIGLLCLLITLIHHSPVYYIFIPALALQGAVFLYSTIAGQVGLRLFAALEGGLVVGRHLSLHVWHASI